MKFLVDANLPRAMTSWLADGGNEASYIDDLLAAPASDDDIWKLAAANAFVVV